MQSIHQQQVSKFMTLAKQEVPIFPTEPSLKIRELRAKLILEEALETIEKGLGVSIQINMMNGNYVDLEYNNLRFEADRPFSLVETADGACDISVVTTGTLSACGLDDYELQEAVNQNNLDKFGPGHTWREDGKLIKPPGHKPPDLAAIIERMKN